MKFIIIILLSLFLIHGCQVGGYSKMSGTADTSPAAETSDCCARWDADGKCLQEITQGCSN